MPLRIFKTDFHQRLFSGFYLRLIGLLTIMLLGAGCPRPVSIEGQAQLGLARRQYELKQFSSAVRVLTDFLEREPRSVKTSEVYYLRGLCYRQMTPERNDMAIRDFQQVIKGSEDEPAWALAQASLGHIYFENQPDESEQAILHYRQALRKLPKEPPRDAVLYRLAVSLQKQGKWSDADLYLSRCFDDFSDSMFARYARDRFGATCWRLQFEAFSSLERANQLVAQLRERGLQADWSPRRVEGKLLYAVRSGRYKSYKQAQQALGQVQSEYPQVEIVPAP